jgi:uncharacterized protein
VPYSSDIELLEAQPYCQTAERIESAAMNKPEVIEKAKTYAREILANDYGGHDYSHTLRVFKNAEQLAKSESCDEFVVGLASLLHDVDDYKLFGGQPGQTYNARGFMDKTGVDRQVIDHVCSIISQMSYTGDETVAMSSIEGMIVQDADRLDAIGAIGIARAFAYGGSKGRVMHDPTKPSATHQTTEQYLSNEPTTINHFYEKLLKLSDQMNTSAGRKAAEHRHRYLVSFLEEFLQEWDGTDLSNKLNSHR